MRSRTSNGEQVFVNTDAKQVKNTQNKKIFIDTDNCIRKNKIME